MSSPLLAVRDVSVTLGGLQILQNVSLQVQPGEVVGLIGPNGAGKTTVFNVICGFIKPDAGAVAWKGRDRHMRPHSLARLGIARTLQGVGLYDSLTVLENLMTGATRRSKSGVLSGLLASPRADAEEQEHRSRARGLLFDMGIGDTIDRLPGDLPYPLRKRVALARALMAEPELIMLDEPAGGLAQEDIDSLGALVRTWAPEKSVLLVEHHMDFVMRNCEHIYVLDAGRIIAQGGPAEVQSDPRVRAAYLGEEAHA
jgi:branched-chain amino acid transport system ATP-binding protein